MDAGNYAILARLSEGPLGTLYEGTHKQTHERVVVRVLPATIGRETNALGRLLALQRALHRLEAERSVVMPMRGPSQGGDPAITGILECGRFPDGSLFVVSEFVSGESLSTQLRRHSGLPLPNKALRIGRQLSALLAVAHGANIHHLALRPDKVLLVSGGAGPDGDHLKLLDLGLLTALGRIPRGDEIPPTSLPYTAPEFRRGEPGAGGPADVFSLAVILHEIGAGGLPTASRSSYPGLAGHEGQTGLMQMLPSWLQPFAELLDRMMQPVPGERPTMSQVAATLQQLSALVPSASGTSLPQSGPSGISLPPPPVSGATPKMAPLLGALPGSMNSLRDEVPALDRSGPNSVPVSRPVDAAALVREAVPEPTRPLSDSQTTPQTSTSAMSASQRTPIIPSRVSLRAASQRTPSMPTSVGTGTATALSPEPVQATSQGSAALSSVTPQGAQVAEPETKDRQVPVVDAVSDLPTAAVRPAATSALRDSQVTPTAPYDVRPIHAAPVAAATPPASVTPPAPAVQAAPATPGATPLVASAVAPIAASPVPVEPARAGSSPQSAASPAAAPASKRRETSLDGEPAEIELSMVEEPTLSSEPTQAGVAAGKKAPAADGVIELNAEYTLNPQRPSERRDSLAFGVTHRSDDNHGPANGTGTGGGRTAATPVEPGLGGSAVLKVGQLVGNFRIVSKIGQGGMGAVYAAVHRQIGRRAAVKVLHGPLAKTSDYAQRFLNEARAVNILRHPNLVEIFDFGQLPDGTLYIIMEFLEGESLRAKLRRSRKLPEIQAIELARQMAQALDAAHQKGIIHRDLKPENVMLVSDAVRPTEDRVKILDFGIAKVNQQSQQNKQSPAPKSEDGEDFQTAIGTTMGTPKYMAPEQYADASKVDGKADVFALGVMLYEMVAGQVPFPKTSLAAFHQPAKPIAEVEPSVSPKLAQLIHRMLTPKSLDRPGMREVLELLTPPATEVLVAVPAPPKPSHFGRWMFLSAIVAAAIMAAGVYIGRTRNPTVVTPPEAPEEADFLIDVAGPKARALGVLYQGLRSAEPQLRGHAALMLGLSRDVTQRSSIATLLKDQNPMVQAQAAEALGQLGASDAHGELLALLDGNMPPGVRVTVAGALARLAHPRGKQVLTELLQDPSESIRITAALLLLESGDSKAAEPLRTALQNPQLPEKLSWNILRRLAQIGDTQAQQQLTARMAGDGFTDRRITAAGYLAALGDDRARALLNQAAQRPGPQQLVAANLLAEVGDFSVYPLFKKVSADGRQAGDVRQLALQGMGSCGRRHGAVLLAGILDELSSQPLLRQQAAGAILQITGGDPAQIARQSMSWAQAALSHDDWVVRQNATTVLADLDSDQAVPLLARALSDSQREVRRSAATALGQKNLRAALSALRVALNDADPEVRQAGLRAMVNILASMGSAGSKATSDETRIRLQQLAESGMPEEQVMASATLARLGDTAQLERLRGMLSSPNAVLRRLLVETTAGDEGLLKQALSDADFSVRFAAARRLGALGQRDAAPVLKEGLSGGGADSLIAYGLLRKLGEAVVPPAGFVDQIGRDTATTRALLEIISDLPPSDVLPLLIKARFDSAPAVRRRVAEVATSFYLKNHDESLLQIVYSLSNDPDVSVRTRTGALLAKLMGKETAPKEPADVPADLASAPVDAGAAPVAQSRGRLRIVGEQWVRITIDQHMNIQIGPPPFELSLDAGPHTVSFTGGAVEVTVPSGDTALVQIPVSHAEQLLHDTADAIARREYMRAQQLLDRARALVGRGRGPKAAQAELLLLQSRLFETQGRLPEAMGELERMQRLPETARKPEQNMAAQAAIARLSARLGRIRVSKEVEGRCVYADQWVRPGEHRIAEDGGQFRTVRVREGSMAEVKLCQGAVPLP